MTEHDTLLFAQAGEPEAEAPRYEPPRVITYRGQDLLEALGPARACTFGGSVITCGNPGSMDQVNPSHKLKR